MVFINLVKIKIRNQDVPIYEFFRSLNRNLYEEKEDWIFSELMNHNMVDWSLEPTKSGNHDLFMTIDLRGNWINWDDLYKHLDTALLIHK